MSSEHNPSEEEIRAIVREELENQTNNVMESVPFTRRDILRGVSILGLGAAGAGLGTYGAIGRAAAQSGSEGSGTIGTSDNPLEAIYVNELYQNTDHINAESVSTDHIDVTDVFSTASDDLELTDALDAASDGDTIHLGNTNFTNNRTVGKQLKLVGSGGYFSGTSIRGDWTISDRVIIKDVEIREVDLTFNADYSAFMDSGIPAGDSVIVSGDRFTATGVNAAGSIVFESGTSDGIVDASSGVSVTDNGNNTVGDIS